MIKNLKLLDFSRLSFPEFKTPPHNGTRKTTTEKAPDLIVLNDTNSSDDENPIFTDSTTVPMVRSNDELNAIHHFVQTTATKEQVTACFQDAQNGDRDAQFVAARLCGAARKLSGPRGKELRQWIVNWAGDSFYKTEVYWLERAALHKIDDVIGREAQRLLDRKKEVRAARTKITKVISATAGSSAAMTISFTIATTLTATTATAATIAAPPVAGVLAIGLGIAGGTMYYKTKVKSEKAHAAKESAARDHALNDILIEDIEDNLPADLEEQLTL